MRTHDCAQMKPALAGQEATLCGWLHARRDHGGVIFFDLRDRSGLVQVVVNPEDQAVFSVAEHARNEYALKVVGKLRKRPEGTMNPNLPSGEVELVASEIVVLNKSKALPFEVDDHLHVNEEVRLKYRYLDLRRGRMQRNLKTRHDVTLAARNYLAANGFWEVETPVLTKSSPEGARDFLVPSRMHPGEFYALPQSPQMFKQILMCSGVERYFQLARAYRDEDLRKDRQPEHTQIDLEMSFVTEDQIHALVEGMMKAIWKQSAGVELTTPFRALEYAEVMDRWGSDKPDLRFEGLEIEDVSELFADSGFKVFAQTVKSGGRVKALKCPGQGGKVPFSGETLRKLEDVAKKAGAKGLAHIKWTEDGPQSPILKFLKDEIGALEKRFSIEPGDVLFFGAAPRFEAAAHLGALRTHLIAKLELKPKTDWEFLWVKRFPLLEKVPETGGWTFSHNPFTSPLEDELPMLDTDPGAMKSHQYDLVLNGVELASGSIRNHRREIQEKIFSLMGYDKEEAAKRFGMLLDALEYGAPPHGGIACGLDRVVALIVGEDSIRDVIAFPKTARGQDLMCQSPSEVRPDQLEELGIKLAPRLKKEDQTPAGA